MAILKADKTTTMNGVTVNEYLLTNHNPNHIAMPSESMEGKIIGVTIHNTLPISEAEGELVSCLLLTSILAGSPWLTDGITPISTFFYTQHHTPGLSSYKDTVHMLN